MTLHKRISEMIKTKLSLIKLQNAELHDVLNRLVDKETTEAGKTLQSKGKNVEDLKTTNVSLESTLTLLFKTYQSLECHTENVLPPMSTEKLLTSAPENTLLPNTPISVALELNRRLESLEFSANYQSEQRKNLEEQVNTLKDALKASEMKHSSAMESIRNQKDDVEDNLACQMKQMNSLKDIIKINDTLYHENMVSKKDFCEILEWRRTADKRLENLASRTDALEYDVNIVMDKNVELDKEVKQTTFKLKEVQTDVKCREEMLRIEKYILQKVDERLEEMNGRRLQPLGRLENALKEQYEKMNTALMLTCQLVTNKLLPLRKVQETLRNTQQLFLEKQKHFETKVNQFMTQSDGTSDDIRQKIDEINNIVRYHSFSVTANSKDVCTMKENIAQMNYKKDLETIQQKLSVMEKMQIEIVNLKSEKGTVQRSAGFTAYLDGNQFPVKGDVIKRFRPTYVENGVFNCTTGEFVAPHEGVYLASLTMHQTGKGEIRAHVCQPPRHGCVKMVCKAKTSEEDRSCCSTGYVRLEAGDKLIVEVIHRDQSASLSPYTSFTCCFLA